MFILKSLCRWLSEIYSGDEGKDWMFSISKNKTIYRLAVFGENPTIIAASNSTVHKNLIYLFVDLCDLYF